MSGLSRRGEEYLKDGGFEMIRQLLRDLYDRDTNPNGIVNMGTAENVCFIRERPLCLAFQCANSAQYVMLPEIAKFVNEKVSL